MKDETRERRRNLLWGLPASLILHALIAALLVYGLPTPPQQPQEQQPVNVALVPPPDQPKPKPAAPKAPKVEKPPEQKVEKPPVPEQQPRKPSPIEILKPVFQFGEKDTGPRKSLDGSSPQDNAPSPAKNDDSKLPVTPKAEEQADSAKTGDNSAIAEPTQQKQAPSAQNIDKQETDKQEAGTQADKQTAAAPMPLAAPGNDGEIELPTSAEAPRPRPTPKPSSAKVAKPGNASARRPSSTKARNYAGLPGVRRLYSQGATGDVLATTSIAEMPRGQRAARLCASALQQQLQDASYFPDLVPLVPLKMGNVLDVPQAAFHAAATWYRLSYRCEVDNDATRVLSFTSRVGTVIPPDEWAGLGLPVR
ncbi:hypothetical protein CN311_19850 [Mesorhizobium sanjuanii]|uniref:DUF930 domain-containing protein n=1 Tax=Mesorhizobium sanjuanii TaxID=2037900 RepID=A0A2A6FCJ6_9HYPH|nr:DUF930 domain-containing protein [Mesorhizobium sanjuanii]PDQ19396.1 hypothetical protein CN311_19850 [Mesorhizobium sanjuanii]